MKAIVLYRSDSDQERSVLEFEREYQHRTGRELQTLDLNNTEGADMAELYDVVRYPAVLALSDSGELLQLWQGDLPLMSDVMYYDRSE